MRLPSSTLSAPMAPAAFRPVLRKPPPSLHSGRYSRPSRARSSSVSLAHVEYPPAAIRLRVHPEQRRQHPCRRMADMQGRGQGMLLHPQRSMMLRRIELEETHRWTCSLLGGPRLRVTDEK